MKRLLTMLALTAAVPAWAQTPPATPPVTPPPYDAGGLPRTPVYHSDEGQPIDVRVPEKKTDTRQFPQQTRAPYHHPTDFTVTAVSSELHAGWASVLLPSGRILISEHLPGQLRLLEKGKLSPPLAGLEARALGLDTPQVFLMDVQADPDYARNHTIFFTFAGYLDKTVYNTAIGRAVVDEDAHAVRADHDAASIARTSAATCSTGIDTGRTSSRSPVRRSRIGSAPVDVGTGTTTISADDMSSAFAPRRRRPHIGDNPSRDRHQ